MIRQVDQLEQSHQQNGEDKSLSDVIKGIDTIITMLQRCVNHTGTGLQDLQQNQDRDGEKLAESLTLGGGPPHNKSTFHHQDIHEEINDEQLKEDIQLQTVTVSKVEATNMVVRDEVKQKGDSNSVVYNNFIDEQHRAKKFDVADFVMVDFLYVDLTEYLLIFSIINVVDMFKLQDEILFYLSGNSRTSFFQEEENNMVKIQKMRSKFEEKVMRKMAIVHRKAEELRTVAQLEHTEQMQKATEQANKTMNQHIRWRFLAGWENDRTMKSQGTVSAVPEIDQSLKKAMNEERNIKLCIDFEKPNKYSDANVAGGATTTK
nr:hypothetical protein [Tanacetum cinerariifolium]